MAWRRINPYLVLLAGYLVGAGIYILGIFATLVWVYEVSPWKFGASWAVVQPIIQVMPFALFAAAAFAARCLDRARIVTMVVVVSAFAVVGVNTALLADWFISEIASARHMRDFLRDHLGIISDGGGMLGIAVEAMGKTVLLSLWLALACILVAILHRFVQRLGPWHVGLGDPRA